MFNRKLIVVIIIILLLVAASWIFRNKNQMEQVTNFEECAEARYAVMESYPRQCRTPEGQTFVEYIGNELEKLDLVRIENPRPNQIINSPLTVEGDARGFWFFEGDFPIKLLDEAGNTLLIAIAKAEGEWMTEDFVHFKVEIEFSVPEVKHGTLILEKDNPSGLPENADQLSVPILFK